MMKKAALGRLVVALACGTIPVIASAQGAQVRSPQITCQEAFRRGDWKALEDAYLQYRRLPVPTAQKLSEECVEALNVWVAMPDTAGWEAMDRKTAEWSANSSRQPIAQIARAKALLDRARMIVNSGRAWGQVDKMLTEALAALNRVGRDSRDGNWYAARLELAKLQGAESGEVIEIARELLASDPYSMAAVNAAVLALDTDRGRGDPKLVEWLARSVLEKTRAIDGVTRYARVYEVASIFFLQLRSRPFEAGRAQWDLLNQAFIELEKRAPELYRIDLHAGFACLAGDKAATAKLLNRIGNKPERTSWYLGPGPDWATGRHYDQCKEWAAKGQRAT